MKRTLMVAFVLMITLAFVMSGTVGCKKKGASKGPGEDMAATPVATPEPTPVTDRYTDEIDDATKLPDRDTEMMDQVKDIHFDYDRYELTSEARDTLAENAIFLKRNRSVALQVEGHCDERGTIEYNLALGQKRADSTKEYLVMMGVDPSRLSTISYGEERPIDPDSSESAWAMNRRAHFVILSR